jgi:hypothetical protein
MVAIRKTAARLQTNFIEHARKKDKAADHVIGTPRELFGHDAILLPEKKQSGIV